MAAQPIIAQTKRFTYAMAPEVTPSFRKIHQSVINWIEKPVNELGQVLKKGLKGELTDDVVEIGGHTFKAENLDGLAGLHSEMKRIKGLPDLERIATGYIEASVLFAKAMISKIAKMIEAKPPVA